MKDHEFGLMVNDLRDMARAAHMAQSLRERLKKIVNPLWEEYKELRDEYLNWTNVEDSLPDEGKPLKFKLSNGDIITGRLLVGSRGKYFCSEYVVGDNYVSYNIHKGYPGLVTVIGWRYK